MRIISLAEKVIHLAGLGVRTDKTSHGDISVAFMVLWPSKKLYKDLLAGENVAEKPHPMIMSANEDYRCWKFLKSSIQELLIAIFDVDFPKCW